MPKNRVVLILLASLLVALAIIVFAPFVVSNGLRVWLHWQAHRQQLRIELGKIAAPFLRPVSVERVRVTSEKGAATQVEVTAERAILHLHLTRMLGGREDGIHALSIQNVRAEIRRVPALEPRQRPIVERNHWWQPWGPERAPDVECLA